LSAAATSPLAQVRAVLDLHAAHRLVVLDRDRHAVQRPDRLAAGQRTIGGAGGLHRFIGREIGEGVQLGLECRDAVEHGSRELDGRQFLGADGYDQLRRRREADIRIIHDRSPSMNRSRLSHLSDRVWR